MHGNKLEIVGRNETEHARLERAILTGNASRLFVPIDDEADSRLLARFLAKVAVETLAFRLIGVEGWEAELDNAALDQIRNFARVGQLPSLWPFSRRRIYYENATFTDGNEEFQVLHEFDLLYTNKQELYAIICLFGEEFAINMGGPEISGYMDLLKELNFDSPLYTKASPYKKPSRP
jgi:hypothetical protein